MSTIVLDLPSLASEINREHRAYESACQTALAHAWEAGRLLIDAKAELEHGQWLDWLAANVTCSERVAQQYMQLASHRGELEANPKFASDMGIVKALELVQEPRAEKPRKPTAGDTIDFLRSQATPSTDPDTSEPVTRESLDEARARLKAAHQAEWSERQERILRRATDHLQTALDKMAAASTEALSAHAIGEIFRGAAAQARHGSAALDDLAFTFESMT